jgi:AcrR family transcriptional regulator
MANIKNNSATQETRRRLLDAAGQVFADHGFHTATIKQITDRAGASLAAVNYHFSDKAELYAAVLRRVVEDVAQIVPPDELLSGSAANRLRQFIRYFCGNMFGLTKPAWSQMVMARELAEPTAALQPLFDTVTEPLNEKLSSLIAELTGLSPDDEVVGMAAASVIGQCVYYMRHKSLIGRMHSQLSDRPDAEVVARHIADFSLAGIRKLRGKVAKRRVSRP